MGYFVPHNVKRREGRAKNRIRILQDAIKCFKRADKSKMKRIEELQNALSDTRSLVQECNGEIRELKRAIRSRDELIDVLESEKEELCEQLDGELARHHAEVKILQERIQKLSLGSEVSTFTARKYNANVRELYYTLLAMHISPSKIRAVVTNVISHLIPSVNDSQLRLPGKSCAAYMRSQEMPTISQAQKASELMKSDQWCLNSDGTTLMQQKKVAFLINGIVFGVHDVPDGASQTTLDALKAELTKTGSVAAKAFPSNNQDFKVSHIVSSTSDSASTQTKLSHLLEKEAGHKIVENKCAMHLGVNLRTAQVKAAANFTDHLCNKEEATLSSSCSSESDYEDVGGKTYEDVGGKTYEDVGGKTYEDVGGKTYEDVGGKTYEDVGGKTYEDVGSKTYEDVGNKTGLISNRNLIRDIDLFVKELAKLFGHLGTPEYCHGASVFRVFLEAKTRETIGDEQNYYLSAQKVVLERQIGNRYYVTSCNAGRLYFLCKAFIAFLEEQKLIKELNQLELTCLQKLHDSLLLTNLRLEGLMFDKVYADLMILVKSSDMKKTAIDMRSHYEELLNFFSTVITEPEVFLDSNVQVFTSESLLYGESKKFNHRLHEKYICVRQVLYESCDSDEAALLPLVSAVSKAMHLKLQQYMKDYLPGGQYHNPDSHVHSVLSKLQPHNDRSESAFGLNDWLNKILPNMAQSTRSTMIEFSFNNTMKWLKDQGEEQKKALLVLAQEQRKAVLQESREASKYVFERKLHQRSEAIKLAHAKRAKKEKKVESIKSHHLITTVTELNCLVANVTSLSIPKPVQDTELREMVKTQKLLRTLVYNQKGIKLKLSSNGKLRPIQDLLKDLATVISTKPVAVRRKEHAQAHQQLYTIFTKPLLLKGIHIKHRFEENDDLKWYEGVVVSINKKEVLICYNEDGEYQFTLEEIKEDFYSGDLVIL